MPYPNSDRIERMTGQLGLMMTHQPKRTIYQSFWIMPRCTFFLKMNYDNLSANPVWTSLMISNRSIRPKWDQIFELKQIELFSNAATNQSDSIFHTFFVIWIAGPNKSGLKYYYYYYHYDRLILVFALVGSNQRCCISPLKNNNSYRIVKLQ